MQGLSNYYRTTFGIKRMGQIDRKPFQALCSKYSDGEAKSAKLCSLWEENVKNPHWHPFKRVENNGKLVVRFCFNTLFISRHNHAHYMLFFSDCLLFIIT